MEDAINILKESPAAAAVIDIQGKKLNVAYANKAFSQMLPNGLTEALQEQILTKKDTQDFPITLEGGKFGQATISHHKENVVLWVVDVSETKGAVEEAEAVLQAKSNFLATMSHEIRSPMQSIYGFLELVLDENINDHVRNMISTARTSASGLLEILDDILDLAKVEAGKIELDNFEMPVRTLAYGVIECMEVKLFGNKVELKAEVDQDVPFVIMGDPTRLRQILLNLVGNSVKFTEHGHVKVKINTQAQHVTAPKGSFVLRVEVEDTGIGMPPEVATRLFQAFTQADNSTTRKYGGTGLGLSISQKLIELMGGQIGVVSEEGKGSTFWFEIPTRAADEQSKVELPDLEGVAVLSVEDHPQGAKEIQSSLSSMGATVVSVPTYSEGLELIDQRPFDVAVIDQGLPDGLGVDLLKYAAKMRPFMGLILYTVRDDLGMQYTAKTVGAKYLSKPASRLGLGEAVKSASKQTGVRELHGSHKILVADDTPSVRDVLKLQFGKLDADVDFVENGAEALKALKEKDYGLLITDLHMPEMDGYEVVKKIRIEEGDEGKEETRFPVVVLTADVQLAQKQAYLAHGFDECLLKPVSLGQLKQLLIRWGILQEDNKVRDRSPRLIEEEIDPSEIGARLIESVLEISNDDEDENGLPPAVDKDAIVTQMGGLDESSIGMLGMFVDITRPYIEKLDSAFEQQNLHDLRETAHSLKGAARSACCPRLGDLAEEIQSKAEQNKDIHSELIEDLKSEFERAEKEIKTLTSK